MTDEFYMKRAIRLAQKGRGETSPNPMVGAVVVKGGKIIAEGWHKKYGQAHAEVNAFNNAKVSLKGATLFVNLEPCHHFGQTPPCVDAVIKSGIKKVVIAMKDPNPLTNGKSITKMKSSGIVVKVGVLKDEAEKLNEAFVKMKKRNMPFVIGKIAQTLDGKIATQSGSSKWITSEATRFLARKLRAEFDAILVGINTVLKDDPSLNADGKIRGLKKIVLDSRLKISLSARLFQGCLLSDCIIATTQKASQQKIKQFRNKGVTVIVCPEKQQKVDLKWLFKELAKQKIMSILIEGGAKVLGSALAEELVDKLHVYIAPKLVGDQNALSSVDGLKITDISKALKLKNMEVQRMGEDIFVSGYLKK
ncbi:MAG: bifunctional diaminohydroxyphosphoribosylaminopyrimidine deaminase/5-amino-6-(5-phosphoribosylamino)uracil reductase RibD [Candidatus Omnitrophica bacterium]|nr:bifunctional diaminohydroxyphosphoribosylaminopyrimidine deaminase/5-amino-6-(5-phosphoribosylamino)uracil reductase RibD [Candidatus Omnitrophota bacterium]